MAKSFSWNLQYKDSTPKLNVMHSAFEHWFQAQPFATQSGIKQMCRDSYAAGMGDPLVTYSEPSVEDGKCLRCGNSLMSDMTDLCYSCVHPKELEEYLNPTIIPMPELRKVVDPFHNGEISDSDFLHELVVYRAIEDAVRKHVVTGIKGASGDTLDDFKADQWWVKELEEMVQNGAPDQKRAVAVVRNLLEVLNRVEIS